MNGIPVAPLKIKSQRLSELVQDQLMDWIMNGTLVMGQRISEEELAEKFGVSRMPVREALRIMEKMGLVESIPYAGSRVRKLSNEEVKEIYLLREILESTACQMAAQRITPEELQSLEALQHRLDQFSEEDQSIETGKLIYQLNREFHMQLYAASKMTKLTEMIDNLWNNIAYHRMKAASSKIYVRRMQEEHNIYIESLRRRDGDTMQRVLCGNLQKHLREFLSESE